MDKNFSKILYLSWLIFSSSLMADDQAAVKNALCPYSQEQVEKDASVYFRKKHAGSALVINAQQNKNMESYYALCGSRFNENYTGNYVKIFEENYPNYIKIQQEIQNEKNVNLEKRPRLVAQSNSQVGSSEIQKNQSMTVDIESGSLGLSKRVWEVKQGKPDIKCMNGYTCYKGGKYMVSFMDGHIWLIEVIISPLPITSKAGGISINESRTLSKSFIPSDGKLIKTYTNRSGSTVDLYMSETLKTLEAHFPANAPGVWTGGEVGNFIVIHSGVGGVTRIVIGTGNNP